MTANRKKMLPVDHRFYHVDFILHYFNRNYDLNVDWTKLAIRF